MAVADPPSPAEIIARLEEQLRQSQKAEAIGHLASGVAHDLNNALTAIAGYAQLALVQVPPGHPARADIEEIRRAAERASSVTRRLLAFSRKEMVEPKRFDLSEAVTNVERLLSRLIGPSVEVRATVSPALPPILADPGQVEQAIVNLAVNARDAMPGGGILELATSVEDVDEAMAARHAPLPRGRYVMLRVTDNGHGMTRETQSRLFEPFFTTKGVGKGTGLGLSMVYGTVKQAGGFIAVESVVGRGTTFRLFFPAEPAPAEGPAASAARPARKGESPTVLVVEDEPSVRNLVASALRQDGYRLLLAGSAEEALSILAAHAAPIDLLLTDANLPGRGGVDLAAQLKAAQPDLRVVVMTGYTEELLRVDISEQRPVMLAKPFTPKNLRRLIRDVLEG